MKIIRLVAIYLFLTTSISAQEEPQVEFGKVTPQDFQDKYYAKDSTANAVVLYEVGEVSFPIDFVYQYRAALYTRVLYYHVRFRIFKKSGVDQGIIKIPLTKVGFAQTEEIQELEGYTYNLENGKVVTSKLTKESIFHEHVIDYNYQDKITMPNVKEGSIVELKYMIVTPFTLGYNPKTWKFQRDIPVVWSEYRLRIPNEIIYRHVPGGYLKFFINRKQPSMSRLNLQNRPAQAYRFVIKDAPAFHNEKFITSEIDYLARVSFELISVAIPGEIILNFSDTWENVVKYTLKDVNLGEALRQRRFLQEIAAQIETIKDSAQKINAAFEHISKNIKWDKSLVPVPVKNLATVYENKKGNPTEINIMLINLLREIGFDANPVIISTRGNGELNEIFPMTGQFNYTLAHIVFQGKDMLLDATDPLVKPGMLPERCLNGTGYLLKNKRSRFVSLAPTYKKAKFETVTASIDPKTGILKGSVSSSADGYDAYSQRSSIKEDGEEEFIRKIKQENAEWQLSNFKIENKEKLSETFNLSCDFESNENLGTDLIYLNPMLLSKITDNPFKETNRIYPVDLQLRLDKAFMGTIKIPEGYVVEEIPEPANVLLPDNLGSLPTLFQLMQMK